MRCVSYARAHVSLATTLETGPEKARYREVQRLVRSHTAGGWGGQGLDLGRAPRKCQPFATALTAHESAVTWKLHLDRGRSQQGDGKWGGCVVAGDGDGKADVWHHHAAGPRQWREPVSTAWLGCSRMGCRQALGRGSRAPPGGSAEGREACDLTVWATGQ